MLVSRSPVIDGIAAAYAAARRQHRLPGTLDLRCRHFAAFLERSRAAEMLAQIETGQSGHDKKLSRELVLEQRGPLPHWVGTTSSAFLRPFLEPCLGKRLSHNVSATPVNYASFQDFAVGWNPQADKRAIVLLWRKGPEFGWRFWLIPLFLSLFAALGITYGFRFTLRTKATFCGKFTSGLASLPLERIIRTKERGPQLACRVLGCVDPEKIEPLAAPSLLAQTRISERK